MDLPQVDDYQSLFLQDVPLLDVRAPVEFEQGAFPHVTNIPLMNDAERQQVGLRYKEQGQDKAIELGHRLVSGEVKDKRVEDWAAFVRQNPQGILYCFRGGLRSRISQQWIYENTGVVYPRVKGGYKALRRFLLHELDASVNEVSPVVLSGRTGIGKTLLLQRIQQQVDLEKIFHHRGSVFGKHAQPQPSQIDIENALSVALLKHRNKNVKHLVMEDEGSNIGSRRLPDGLCERMKQSPIVILEASVGERVDIIFNEYIVEALNEYKSVYGEDRGFIVWAENLRLSLDKIQRRLGGLRHKELKAIMDDAIQQHLVMHERTHHKTWIKSLLVDYYDPMYDYQLSRKQDRMVFQGEQQAVLEFLAEQYNIA